MYKRKPHDLFSRVAQQNRGNLIYLNRLTTPVCSDGPLRLEMYCNISDAFREVSY